VKKLEISVRAICSYSLQLLNDEEINKQLGKMLSDCLSAYENNQIICSAGNGGSAAQSEHFIAELTGRFEEDRDGYPAINLNSNLAELSAISNDYGYENSISRNIKSFSKVCGVCIFFTTSGTSKNIQNAIKECKKLGISYWVLTSKKCKEEDDHFIKVPSQRTAITQELHLMILHWLVSELEFILQ